jgi:glycosyltransferase involved in cell wall biosynthesis
MSGVTFSIVIATYNRARDLEGTLASLASLAPRGEWEVVVVDNNSTDDTRQVVEGAAPAFPVELRYVFEGRQGRSPALNAGILAARGEIIATTDDDVRVNRDWLDRAAEALEEIDCDYVGGRVLPIWGGPRPRWLADRPGKQWAVVALLDYGPHAIEFGTRVPLGVNMAFRREAFDRAGLFDISTGRRAGTLLGQEVREWCIRARATGLRGFYVPAMCVHHIIPPSRLRKSYFRRWFFWRGISRAQLYQRFQLDMLAPEQTTLDYSRVPHIAGVPRFMYRQALREFRLWAGDLARRRGTAAFEHELWLCFFAGVLKQRVVDSRGVRPPRTAAGVQGAGG